MSRRGLAAARSRVRGWAGRRFPRDGARPPASTTAGRAGRCQPSSSANRALTVAATSSAGVSHTSRLKISTSA